MDRNCTPPPCARSRLDIAPPFITSLFVRYLSLRPADLELREAMKMVASELRRFGYRRIQVMLQRRGIVMNLKSCGGCMARSDCRCVSAVAASGPWARGDPCWYRTGPTSAGAWTSSATPSTDGRRFRVLTVVADHTRECLALIADISRSRRARARWRHCRTRPASGHRLRRRDGVHQHGDPAMVAGPADRLALHRSPRFRSRRR
jgi:hypothetical protein